MPDYYMLVEEWLYPTESGKDPCEYTWDTPDEAMAYAEAKVREEEKNFPSATACDCLPAARCEPCNGDAGSFIVTTKDGVEPWYYACRVFKVAPLTTR